MTSQRRSSFADYSSDVLLCSAMAEESESSFDVTRICALEKQASRVKSNRRSSFAMYEMVESTDDCSDSATCLVDDAGSLFLNDSVSSSAWNGEWGEVDSVYPDIQIKEVPVKKVHFDCVKIREFALTIGETQALDEYQCPLELSWTHCPIEHILVLSPLGQNSPVSRSARRLSLRERQSRLMESQRHVASWRHL